VYVSLLVIFRLCFPCMSERLFETRSDTKNKASSALHKNMLQSSKDAFTIVQFNILFLTVNFLITYSIVSFLVLCHVRSIQFRSHINGNDKFYKKQNVHFTSTKLKHSRVSTRDIPVHIGLDASPSSRALQIN
jgi:hypothetical protein